VSSFRVSINLDSELRVWLIDQKRKNLIEAVRLADQYEAVRKADRPIYKGHESSKGHATKPKSFGESRRSNAPVGVQKTSFSHYIKPHDEQKSSATYSSAKFDRFAEEKALGLCLHCRKKVIECPTVPNDGQGKNRVMLQYSYFQLCPLQSLKVRLFTIEENFKNWYYINGVCRFQRYEFNTI